MSIDSDEYVDSIIGYEEKGQNPRSDGLAMNQKRFMAQFDSGQGSRSIGLIVRNNRNFNNLEIDELNDDRGFCRRIVLQSVMKV